MDGVVAGRRQGRKEKASNKHARRLLRMWGATERLSAGYTKHVLRLWCTQRGIEHVWRTVAVEL